MKPRRFPFRFRTWGILLIAAILVSLAVLPQTGWIVRRHLGWSALSAYPDGYEIMNPYPPFVLWREPRPADTYEAALLHALTDKGGAQEEQAARIVDRLQAMVPRYGDRPALHAHILRYLCSAPIAMNRSETKSLDAPMPNLPPMGAPCGEEPCDTTVYTPPPPPPVNQPNDLLTFFAAVEAGERLDPDNGFFPVMRAVGLFVQKRDTEALAALETAGKKRDWNDYGLDEAKATTSAIATQYAEPGAGGRFQLYYQVASRYAITFREAASIAIVIAVGRESKGDYEGGLRIRHSVTRWAALIQGTGKREWDIAISYSLLPIIAKCPRGSQTQPAWSMNTRPYIKYLHRIGAEKEAVWFSTLEKDYRPTEDEVDFHEFSPEYENIVFLHYAAVTLLRNLLLTILFGGMAFGVLRISALRRKLERAPSHKAVTLNCSVDVPLLFVLGINTAVPTLLTVICLIRAKWRREPVLLSALRSVMRSTIPVALALTVAYTAVVIAVFAQDTAMQVEILDYQRNPRTYAAKKGTPWPGRIAEPSLPLRLVKQEGTLQK